MPCVANFHNTIDLPVLTRMRLGYLIKFNHDLVRIDLLIPIYRYRTYRTDLNGYMTIA
jgi:hypothetical protein